MAVVTHAANRGEELDVTKVASAIGLSEDEVRDALRHLTSIGYVTPMFPHKSNP